MRGASHSAGVHALRGLTCRSASSAFAVGLAVFLCGCDDTSKGPHSSGSATTSASADGVASGAPGVAPSRSAELLPSGIRSPDATTSPEIAIANFDGQFEQLERALKAKPDDLVFLRPTVGAYLDQVTYFGKMNAIERVLELAERATNTNPKEPKAFFLRSSGRSMIHDFKAALADLDEAKRLGANEYELAPKRAVIAMALGNYDAAEPVFAEEVKRFPNLNSLGLHAVCLGHMGKTAQAEAAFQAAEATYRDVSPFAIAWLYFNRAELWQRAGDAERARALYTIVVERLPSFARAAIHLSELLPPARGKPFVEKVLPTSDDPEVSSALFLMNEALTPGSGKAHLERATKRYDELMAKYPLAFADHVAEFHLHATKDSKKAAEAAKINFANRKTAESFDLYVEALVAAGDVKMACQVADEAAEFKYPTRALRLQRMAAYRACGKPALADALATGLPASKP